MHKHVPERTRWAGPGHPPIFQPAVGRFAQGMLVNVPLALWALPKRPKPEDLPAALAERYAGSRFVRVAPLGEAEGRKELEPQALNGTNMMELFVFDDEARGRAAVPADRKSTSIH